MKKKNNLLELAVRTDQSTVEKGFENLITIRTKKYLREKKKLNKKFSHYSRSNFYTFSTLYSMYQKFYIVLQYEKLLIHFV